MVDPATLTAGAIATLAFQKFIETSAGKLTEKFSEAAIAKMDDLRQRIWAKLRGRPYVEKIKTALEDKTARITPEQVNQVVTDLVVTDLQVAMDEDSQFAAEIRALAHEILVQVEDHSSMTQINHGNNNYQVKTGDNNTNFFNGNHQHG